MWFDKEDNMKDKYFIEQLSFSLEKKILIGILENEFNIDENYKYKDKIPLYKNVKKGKEKKTTIENEDEEYDKEKDKDLYLDFINFNKKEKILKELKANNYFNKVFYPNKNMNDLLILLQKGILLYYKNKGTKHEQNLNKTNNEIKRKLRRLNRTNT